MKYYSEDVLKHWIPSSKWLAAIEKRFPEEVINVRRCRDCEYFIPEDPAIDPNENFGYCDYRTDYTDYMLNDGAINWYYTSINGFCNENDIGDRNGS